MTLCRVRVSAAGDDEYAPLLRRAVRVAVKSERFGFPCMADVIMVTDEEIRAVNRERRGVDKVTDVLSFPARHPDEIPVPDPDTGRVFLGDILIASERAAAQAYTYQHSEEREIAYLAAHGALHLLGYDHEGEWERAVMRRKEEAVMQKLGLSR
ncbi:MAG: rRNA maturation RNase YbeY [Oscillospiraceae bacterium]|jgi:probable rRNA maturation factor|nr:rRNA maturation RNase YbeY [Oscillospiraceae bacterium]